MHHPPLILASQSNIRAAILQEHGIRFDIVPANIDERTFDDLDASGIAKAKALHISDKYPNHWVIGADQICHLNGIVFHKPVTIENAIKTLQQFEGKSHTLLTAACIALDNAIIWETTEEIKLTMKPLSIEQIRAYVSKDMPLQSCGAYCYEKKGQTLFRSVSHPTESIQGLPIQQLLAFLKTYQRHQ
jgi:septum formation protein